MTRQYERPTIQRAKTYLPGEQPDDEKVIKLNTNESPYPPAPEVARALRNFDVAGLRRYPQPTALTLRQAIQRLHKVPVDSILVTNGGDELLRLAITTFVEPGERIGYAKPSYSLYSVLADLHGAEVCSVDLSPEWRPPANFAAQMNDAGVKVTFLVNPHAPSGALLTVDEVAHVAKNLDGVLLLDEAYVDFVDPEAHYDALPLVEEHDNVLVLRTLSKGYGLAGLRCGYGIGSAGLIEPMQTKTKDSYNTDALSQALATAAIEAQDYAAGNWQRVRMSRSSLLDALRTRGFKVLPSQANFLLATAPQEMGELAAATIYEQLKRRGILVRYFESDARLSNSLRISVGTPAENEELLSVLDELTRRP